MSKNSQNKLNIFPVVSLTILGLFFLIVALVLFNLQYLKDTLIVWSTQTPATTLNLVKDGGMNGKGQFYYLASTPQLAKADQFNDACRDDREQSDAILGCYTASQQIYVYDINDNRLAGVREVTAVHEALHAAYDRLSIGDKIYVNKLLEKEYAEMSGDLELKERMDYYNKTEPGHYYNELHSIIGTEKSQISRSLEEYYAKYFTDRQKTVNLHLSYAKTIKDLSDQAKKLSEQITTSKNSVESKINQYNQDVNEMNSSIAIFNENADVPGYFKSQSEFNQARRLLLNRANKLDADYDAIEVDIKRHDDLVNEYNATAVTINEMNNNLNSTLAPKPNL